MRTTLLAATTLSAAAFAVTENASFDNPKLLHFPIKASVESHQERSRRQLQEPASIGAGNKIYTVEIGVGTPSQNVQLRVHTGASELWVNPVCSNSPDPAFCESTGRLENSASSVDLYVDGGIQYPDGYVEFRYYYDTMEFGGATMVQQIFGVAYDSVSLFAGVLPLAPGLYGWDSSYPFFLDTAYYQNLINSRTFSLDLRAGSTEDSGRYVGSLQKLPVVPAASSPDGTVRYWVQLDTIVANIEGDEEVVISSSPLPVNLDSGSTLCSLPASTFQSLLTAFPSAILIPGSDMYSVDCADRDIEGSVDFTFGSNTIQVPFKDFLLESNGQCFLGAIQNDFLPVLGTTFLNAAYVVFDWGNREIHLAQIFPGECEPALLANGQGPDAMPSVRGGCTVEPEPTPTPTPTIRPSLTPTSSLSTASASSASVSTTPSPSSSMSSSTSSTFVSSPGTSTPSSTISSISVGSSTVMTSSSSTMTTLSTSKASSMASSSGSSRSSSITSTDLASSTSSSSTSSSGTSEMSVDLSTSSSTSTVSVSASESSFPSASKSVSGSSSIFPSVSKPSSAATSQRFSSRTSETGSQGNTLTVSPDSVESTGVPSTTQPPAVTPLPMTTEIVKTTTTYVVTSCPETVIDCPVGHVTTETLILTTTHCPQTTGTYTLTQTHLCHGPSCTYSVSSPLVETHVVTIVPHTTADEPVRITGEGPATHPYDDEPVSIKLPSSTPASAHVSQGSENSQHFQPLPTDQVPESHGITLWPSFTSTLHTTSVAGTETASVPLPTAGAATLSNINILALAVTGLIVGLL